MVERQSIGQDPTQSYSSAPRKIQSPSCSAISVHSDDETVNFTGCTELSAGRDDRQPNSGMRSFPNAHEISSNGAREYRDTSSHSSNHWDSHSVVHGNSVQSNESALSAMLAEISSPLHRMEAPILNERQKTKQRNYRQVEEVANLLESQLDEVESSHGSYEVYMPLLLVPSPIRYSPLQQPVFLRPLRARALSHASHTRPDPGASRPPPRSPPSTGRAATPTPPSSRPTRAARSASRWSAPPSCSTSSSTSSSCAWMRRSADAKRARSAGIASCMRGVTRCPSCALEPCLIRALLAAGRVVVSETRSCSAPLQGGSCCSILLVLL